jgi:hypothetical protein
MNLKDAIRSLSGARLVGAMPICSCFFSAVTLVTGVPAHAQQVTYMIHSSALNTLTRAAGSSLAGNAGTFSFTVPVPCFPDFWRTCYKELYHESLLWMLSDVRLTIDVNGIVVQGHLRATFGALQYETTVRGGVNLAYNGAERVVEVKVPSVKIPVTVDVPLFGPWTITTLNIDPRLNTSIPVEPAVSEIIGPDGTMQQLFFGPQNISFAFGADLLQVIQEIRVWKAN